HQKPYDALPFDFAADGQSLRLRCDTQRPMAHVLANPLGHGAIVSNEGALFSFAGNSQQNGLSPFRLDVVPTQAPAQMIYVKDQHSGEIDTPFFVPYRHRNAEHHAVFGLGYAEFHKRTAERELSLELFLPPDQPIEIRILKLRNKTDQAMQVQVAFYMEIALAQLVRDSLGHIETAKNNQNGTLYFRNKHNDFQQGWAFVATDLPAPLTETLRSHFVGGEDFDLSAPYMLKHGRPDLTQADDGHRIAVQMANIEVAAHSETALVMLLGQCPTQANADALVRRFCNLSAAQHALEQTKHWWQQHCGVLRVESNRPDVDRMVNHWLPYQLLTSRLWGRAGPNQRSGAFGFRDQLQDVLPLILTQPALARQQILLNAAQQFREGDVLKWWHPSHLGGTGLGQRTRAGDPHLWLPYVLTRYVSGTGDESVLHEIIPYIEGDRLPAGVQDRVLSPRLSRDKDSLYAHCKRAIELSLSNMGAHGLPCIGAGDWNDGFDRVGTAGKGESIWLGFLLYDVLLKFADLAERIEGQEPAVRYRAEAEHLHTALTAQWREDRYVRLISDMGEEVSLLDALSAAWPSLSGVADLERGQLAIETALKKLEQDDLILLLDRPFDEYSSPYLGRIADYPPGVRENGGQYSHGTSWLVDALMSLSQQATAAGQDQRAQYLQKRAAEIWLKISPLDTLTPELWPNYGLAPHQQAADVYFAEGYEGHGGWSWYTGAAARMMSAAYALMGIRVCQGELVLDALPTASDSP
ncbi:MAG TPA: hypothetical protein VFV48_06305, partial [Pseudomonadales bacterium]|nr:hypothetical protein [Pseudomonadales bacterium]